VVPHGVLVPREVRGEFWGLVRGGLTPAQAAVELGVSKAAGNKWFRDAGGVLPRVDACPADASRRTITLAERESIGLLRAAGMGVRAIARELGRQPGVISKEIARNLNRAGEYRPLHAQSRAEQRSRRAKPAKLAQLGPLRDFVVAGLKEAWSPEQISNVLRVEFPDDPAMRACPETIYQALYVQSRGALRRDLAAKLRSGRATRKLRRPATHEERRGRLANTISISQRPAEAADRAVPGHWEGDLIMGRENGSAIGTLVERSTRFVLLVHLPGRHTAEELYKSLVPTIQTLPVELRRSLTWDNGKEMARHAEISLATDMAIYFADPGAPWQRGTNENTNGLLRQYFPKGISLRQFGPEDLREVAAQLNGRPRKTLGWKSPAHAMNQLLS
jgi:transposase, IS30 family